MGDHVTFQYNKIDQYLYLGTNLCCKMHAEDFLAKEGIEADLDMEEFEYDGHKHHFLYNLWLPVEDHTAPEMNQLHMGVSFIEECSKNKIKVFLHCKNGHGRSPTMAIAYFIYKGMSYDEAYEKVKKGRDEIHPEPEQVNILKEFETLIR